MKENELLEIATGKKRLVDFPTPFFGRTGLEVSREVDINMPGTGMAIAMPLLMIIVVGVPVANILHRAGRSRWWIPKLSLTSLCQTDTST